MKVTVIGLGNVGTVAAAGFALSGHQVLATDVDLHKIQALRDRGYCGPEPELRERIAAAMEGGNIRFRHSDEVAEELGDVALVAVGTPSGEGYSVELGQVKGAVTWVRKRASSGLVLAMKSTVPPGAGARILERELRGTGICYAANPEFLRVGQAVRDWDSPDRIVIGTAPGDSRSLEIMRSLYEGIDSPVLAADITTAEMIKYASNAFLATRISFINEIAAICDQVGASIDDVSEGLAMDSRTGAGIFAGAGYGGPCLPKDTGALLNLARQTGASADLLQAVVDVNQRQWQLPLRALRDRFGDRLKGLKVAVLGLAFKPGTGDLTEAPAVKLALALAEEGAELTAYDPYFRSGGNEALPVAMRVAPDVLTATAGTQAAAVMTEWGEIVEADWGAANWLMAPPRFIFDGRNALDQKAMKSMGFEYVGVGRGSMPHGSSGR